MNSDKSQPLVTVYMPTYNRVELLQRAVDSVLKQDYRNIELIVVDDNSTDSTHAYLAKMADEDPRFKYFINEKNSGACVSRNKAIFAANGEFITGLDDDDYFLYNHISSYVKAWGHACNNYIALYSNAYVRVDKIADEKKHKLKKIHNCSNYDLLSGNWIGNQLFTKTVYLQNIGGFDPIFPAWQDLDCWYSLLSHYQKKAALCVNYGYVIDKSHLHERISSKKVSNIYIAYNHLCDKYNLSRKDRSILKSQLYLYSMRDLSFIDFIRALLNPLDMKNLERRREYLRRILIISGKKNLLKLKSRAKKVLTK